LRRAAKDWVGAFKGVGAKVGAHGVGQRGQGLSHVARDENPYRGCGFRAGARAARGVPDNRAFAESEGYVDWCMRNASEEG
jgi:hypothetical protein